MVFVSHDRWFVSELATRILEVTPDGPRDFPGTYAEYLERCGDDHLDADAVVLKAKAANREGAPKPRVRSRQSLGGAEEAAQPAEGAARAPRQGARRHRGGGGAQEGDRRALRGDGFFTQTSKEEILRLEQEKTDLAARVESLLKEWEALEAEIAGLS